MLRSFVLLCGPFGCGTGADLNQLVNVSPLFDAGAPAAGDGASFQDPFAGAGPYSAPDGGKGSHNAGKSCIESGCHVASSTCIVGGTACPFVIGGTVYLDYKGAAEAGAPGVEVRIVDSAGHVTSTYSGPEGNFYIMSTNSAGVTFPAVVGVRDADGTRPMITALTAASLGSCGQATCHIPGGGPLSNTGNYYPIHVP